MPFVEALHQEGIMTRPVTSFGAPDCVRISIGDEEATTALIAALYAVSSVTA
jgi:histidinol-phosphate/aromatic aminotransferase/cobyric acid decarboxylase-like protein